LKVEPVTDVSRGMLFAMVKCTLGEEVGSVINVGHSRHTIIGAVTGCGQLPVIF